MTLPCTLNCGDLPGDEALPCRSLPEVDARTTLNQEQDHAELIRGWGIPATMVALLPPSTLGGGGEPTQQPTSYIMGLQTLSSARLFQGSGSVTLREAGP